MHGSEVKLLFKNNFISGPFTISPDDRYLACCGKYTENMTALQAYSGLTPGESLFVLSLEDKTFTYFLTDKQHRK